MKEIRVGVRNFAKIDDDDFEMVSRYSWWINGGGYAMRNLPKENGKHKAVLMHREIMNAEKGQLIDHINGDGLDNRKENLRFATHSQNTMNSRLSKGNTSGFKGVSWQKQDRKWRAKIVCEGKFISLGMHKTPLEAAKAYNEGAIKYHKQFARLNDLTRAGLSHGEKEQNA